MKIAFIVQDLVGQGVQYATAAMVRAFSARGYDIDLLVSKVHNDYLKEGRKSFEVPATVNWIHMPSRRSSRNILFLRRYVKRTDAAYVIAESGLYAQALRVATLGLRSVPKLVQVHHWNVDPAPVGFVGKMVLRFKYWLMYRTFYARFHVNDRARQNTLKRTSVFPPERVCTVYNVAVDDVFFRKVKEQPTHPWLKDKTCLTLVTAGACEPYKGHLTLLKAMKAVNDCRRVRLIIFGRGHLMPQYQEFIRQNHLEEVVSVGGFTDNLPAEMRAADGFVLSSVEESFGIVVAEALACGLYVISTDAPDGPREILEHGKYGTLVPVGDVDAMAKAIIDFANNPKREVPEEAWNRFTEEKICDRYLKGLGLI